MQEGPIFDGDDLSGLETLLATAGARIRLRALRARTVHVRLWRRIIGPATLVRVHIDGVVVYRAGPLRRCCAVLVQEGWIEPRFAGERDMRCGPGQLVAFDPPGSTASGILGPGHYMLAMLDPDSLARPADSAEDATSFRLGGHHPVDTATAAQARSTLVHLWDIDPGAMAMPLLARAGAEFLAAGLAAAFPAPAYSGLSADDLPDTVRRAIVFMHAHFEDDISAADIADAAALTVRGIQMAFRRHLDTTPLAYLRGIRLDAAHARLQAAHPGAGNTVTAIARSAGFTHPGRFAIAYRHRFGRPPADTLHAPAESGDRSHSTS